MRGNKSKHVETCRAWHECDPPNFYIIRKNIINLEHNIERKKEKNIQTLHKDSVKRNKTSKSSKRHQIAGMLRHIFFEAISTIDRKFVEMKIKTIKIKPRNKNKKNHIKMKQQVNSNLDSTNHESSMVTIDRKKHRKI